MEQQVPKNVISLCFQFETPNAVLGKNINSTLTAPLNFAQGFY